jgi:hypothetical protein
MFLYKKDKREFWFYFIILNVWSSKILFFFGYFASDFFRVRYLSTCVLSRITFKIRWMGNAVPSSERSDKRGDIIAPPRPPQKIEVRGGGHNCPPVIPLGGDTREGYKYVLRWSNLKDRPPIVIWILLRPGGIIVLTFIRTHVKYITK